MGENWIKHYQEARRAIARGMSWRNVLRHAWGHFANTSDGRILAHLTLRCNLRCSYCSAERADGFKGDQRYEYKELSGHEWVESLNRSNRDIILTGGEPTLHKDIWYIVNNLKNQAVLTTNLIFSTTSFLNNMSKPIRICASYHPSGGPAEKYIRKIRRLKKYGYWDGWATIHIVDSPESRQAIDGFRKAGIEITIDSNIVNTNPCSSGITKTVKCTRSRIMIAPDGTRYPCTSKMLRQVDGRENITRMKLKELKIISPMCKDYGLCAHCDFRHTRIKILKG